MAYQTRGRDPLFDSNMQAAIEKRGKELLGIVLALLGLAVAAMVFSYHPEDPSFMSATDAPVRNWMGRPGASIAAFLFVVVGNGSWILSLALIAWGLRLALHHGSDRAFGRLIFLPILIAVTSVYAATLVPGTEWTHGFGLGGRFGDTILGAFLNFMPVGMSFGLKLASVLLALAMIALAAFVLGFTVPELQLVARFLLVGIIMAYAALMTALGRGATGAVSAAQTMQARNAARRETRDRLTQQQAEWQAQNAWAEVPEDLIEEIEAPEPAKPGLLARMPALIRRPEPMPDQMPEPELVERHSMADIAAPEDARIKAKIADVIRNRVRETPVVQPEIETPLTKGRGRGPDPLVLNPHPNAALPPEPPLTSGVTTRTQPVAAPLVTPRRVVQPQQAEPVPEPHYETLPETGFDAEYSPFAEDVPQEEVPIAHFPQAVEVPMAYQPTDPVPAAPLNIPTPEPRKVVQHLNRKPVQPSTRARAEAQPSLQFEEKNRPVYDLPPLNLLTSPTSIQRHHLSDDALEENARMLENVLDDYGVKGEIVSVRPGPVVTMYELEPAPGLKASRVIGLSDDIARSMSALSARVSTVPGRSVIGIELPNENREKVVLREILAARDFGDSNMKLPLALGKDIGGDPIVANLAKMPHLLIAGTTGSGKSVAINTMILSLLYRLTPEDCRLIMIDPKMLELSVYDGIPHLLSPVVTDPKKAVVALKWVVGEMEDRYRKMSKMGVRNIDGYNSRVADALAKGETFSRTVQTGFDDDTGEPVFETEEITPLKMPYIVVIVDEMADLMMVAGKEIEACIQRLAQMARASGIHLIMATQRPSVDVITGTIKANFPTRISFQVTSKIDSRTILGEMGAEQLLGMGDMLYMAGGAKITRCHGPFVSDEEVEEIVNHLKAYGPPDYIGGVVEGPDEDKESDIDAVLGLGGNTTGEDALYDQAVAIVIKDRKCSTSYIQRKLAIGYNKAARLVEQMEDERVVSAANHVGKREILVPEQQ
ncbi:DNA translocase FtsK [Thalassovita gelatinovora]|uniref:DNA translocase FtsK n=1 Tax=Thalassovita gelatinovora TaxID=53501 RepID=A0A0P1F633_THAGE|nr:DNA translocase FtsK [Thalassovita gelatinovora]QIZ80888.1 DNA translocase FtsK [Thalassovita gelatinovora]CUH63356.1 DNA translocase FtsK [Thalassovita gelatinovora]SEQ65699.1 DNA translocase FtsK [Thalassovita gelatinovora]